VGGVIRPLLPADVPAARAASGRAFTELDARFGYPAPETTPETVRRSEARIAHLQRTDPGGAWVAEVDGEVVGCSVALVRDGMWFLSLLTVDPSQQGAGLGRQLLEAALSTSTDRSWILSTVDPRALRRYRRAGFDLHAAYDARGPVDRSVLPAVQGVREGSYDADAGLVDQVARTVRGAGAARDLPYLQDVGARLVVVDDPAGQGFAFLRPGGVAWLGATTEDAARRLLWTAIGEAGEKVEVDWLSAGQQWAIDVCLEARLPLAGGASLCLRGQQPMPAYLPHGALG
jgi:predicted N-acetyltransferase YhbS